MHQKTSGKDWIWEPTRQAIYLRDGDRCVVCGDCDQLSLDHVEPGGGRSHGNLVTLCLSCNASKRGEEAWWTPTTAQRCREAAARPLTRELRAEGRRRAEERRPLRFMAHRARAAKQTDRRRGRVPPPSSEAPF